MVAERCVWPVPARVVEAMSGVEGNGGGRAGGGIFDDDDADLRRGEGGYEGGSGPVAADGEAHGSGSFVQDRVEALERKIREVEVMDMQIFGNVALVHFTTNSLGIFVRCAASLEILLPKLTSDLWNLLRWPGSCQFQR